MTSTRFLTGSLATLAVASAFTLAAPVAQAAEDRPCGQPEIAAVYDAVEIPAVFRTVPAVTHSEWLWEREVPTYEYEFTKLVSPAVVESDWTRQVAGPLEFLFTRTVVDSPAVPAIPAVPAVGHFETVVVTPAVVVTQAEYQHERTGNLRWEDENWGAQNGDGKGWSKTGNTRQVETTPAVTTQTWVIDVPAQPAVPAVPEVSHPESQWAFAAPAGDGWTPVDERPGPTSTESTTTDGAAPAGDGWTLVETRTTDAVIDTLWAPVAPDGYTPTGAAQIAGSTHEATTEPTAVAPDGDGWTQVADSEVLAIDVPEQQELVTPGYVEQVLVSAAVPATEACVEAPAEEETTEEPGSDDVAGPTDTDTDADTDTDTDTDTDAEGGAAPVATVLPNTGNDIPPWMAPAGLAAMLAGIGVIRFSRRTSGL